MRPFHILLSLSHLRIGRLCYNEFSGKNEYNRKQEIAELHCYIEDGQVTVIQDHLVTLYQSPDGMPQDVGIEVSLLPRGLTFAAEGLAKTLTERLVTLHNSTDPYYNGPPLVPAEPLFQTTELPTIRPLMPFIKCVSDFKEDGYFPEPVLECNDFRRSVVSFGDLGQQYQTHVLSKGKVNHTVLFIPDDPSQFSFINMDNGQNFASDHQGSLTHHVSCQGVIRSKIVCLDRKFRIVSTAYGSMEVKSGCVPVFVARENPKFESDKDNFSQIALSTLSRVLSTEALALQENTASVFVAPQQDHSPDATGGLKHLPHDYSSE